MIVILTESKVQNLFPSEYKWCHATVFSVPDDLLEGSCFLGALSSECSATYKKILNYFLSAAKHTLHNIYHFSHF